MDEHGCLIYELVDNEWVGECSCRLQVRARTEPGMLREWYIHAGFLNPHLKREVERQRSA